MAAKPPTLFLEDSDSEGSINTTTTANTDDSDKEYKIELILAETQDEVTGALQYLIKWEGYPLYQATWEPADKFTEYEDLLSTWEAKKEEARRPGGKALFDTEEFAEAFELEEERKRLKKRKRTLKRRRRGEYVPSDEDEDEDEWELPTTEAPKSTRAKAPPASPRMAKRKGVARAVQGGGKGVALTDLGDEDNDVDSLFGEPRDHRSSTENRSSVTSSAPNASAPRPSQPTRKSSAGNPSRSTISASTAQAKSKAAGISVTAAPVATAKRSKNVFASDWTADKKRRMRQTVSGDTPKNSSNPKFTSLAVQNRYQKYGRQNEPAPNLKALTIVDPKTGQVQQPAGPSRKPADIDRAYGRRSSPRRGRQRSRSRSPPVLDARQPARDDVPRSQMPSAAPQIAQSRPTDSRKGLTCADWRSGTCQYTAETCPFAHANVRKAATCFYWMKSGNCRYTEEQCDFAHHDTGIYVAGAPGTVPDEPKIKLTCYFWRIHGKCTKGDRCPYEHWDTGAYKGPPGSRKITYREDQAPRAPVTAAKPELLKPRVEESAARDSTAVPENRVTEPQPLQLSDPVASSMSFVPMPYGNATEPERDPRLRGRRSSAGKPAMQSPGEAMLPPMTPGNDSDAMAIDTRTGAMAREHQMLVQELEIAKRAVPFLDFLPFIQTSEGEIIEKVFLQMPRGRSGEMSVLKERLKGWNCKVFTSRDHGQWDYFKRNPECLIIVHPTENFCGTMPGLYSHLMKGSAVKVFSIGVQHARCIMEDREPAYEAHRIFPMGGITFITDDVFVYYPEKATEIIEAFLTGAKPKPLGGEFSKIGARPGIKDWLLRLASRKLEEQDGPDEEKDLRWIKVYDAVCQLCPVSDEDPRCFPDRSVPLERSFLWSADETHFPSFTGRWEDGDEAGATDYMVNFFAGEAVCAVGTYRRFVVVYQRPEEEGLGEGKGPDPRGWMEKYSHIGVMTPEMYLASKKS